MSMENLGGVYTMKKLKIFYPHWREKNHLLYNRVEKQKIKGADTMKEYEERIVEEICSECNFVESIIVRLFKKVFVKVYNISRINTINKFLS